MSYHPSGDNHWTRRRPELRQPWAKLAHDELDDLLRRFQAGEPQTALARHFRIGRTTVGRGESGDIYAGHNGNVYRRDDSGSWSHWSDGGWSPADKAENRGQLERDRAARAQGRQRTDNLGSYRQAPSRERAGSFGGGRRAGGRRR